MEDREDRVDHLPESLSGMDMEQGEECPMEKAFLGICSQNKK